MSQDGRKRCARGVGKSLSGKGRMGKGKSVRRLRGGGRGVEVKGWKESTLTTLGSLWFSDFLFLPVSFSTAAIARQWE